MKIIVIGPEISDLVPLGRRRALMVMVQIYDDVAVTLDNGSASKIVGGNKEDVWSLWLTPWSLESVLLECQKIFSQWERIFHLQAALPFAEWFGTASGRRTNTGLGWCTYASLN